MRDIKRQRECQLRWMKDRRQSWIAENGPCKKCGSWERLEVDHINRVDKIDHKVWSWSEPRRLAELAKCQVLCFKCHLAKTLSEIRALNDAQVFQVWDVRQGTGASVQKIAKALDMSLYVVRKIVYKERYRDVTDRYFLNSSIGKRRSRTNRTASNEGEKMKAKSDDQIIADENSVRKLAKWWNMLNEWGWPKAIPNKELSNSSDYPWPRRTHIMARIYDKIGSKNLGLPGRRRKYQRKLKAR